MSLVQGQGSELAQRAHITGATKKNQIALNLVTNILSMGISMLISLWITPYLITKLGIAAYGYIGLINNAVNFIYVITYMLTSMVARFLTISLDKNGPQEASQYISSAFFTILFLGLLLLPLILFVGSKFDRFLNIQKAYVVDVKISFVLAGVALIINSIYSVLSSGAYSKNRLDINNGIQIFSNIIRITFLLLIFTLFDAQIWHYTISSVLQMTTTLVLYGFFFRALLPDVQFSIRLFKLTMAWELLSAGLFNSIVMLGNNFLTQIDLIVGNKYLAADIVGMYAATLLIPNSIRNIAAALSYAFSPTTVNLFSKGNMEELRNYTNKVVKFCGVLIGWPVSVLSGLIVPILGIWLGRDYSPYEFVLVLMLLPLTLNLAVNQLYIVQQAVNKLRTPALVAILFGLLNIVLAVFFTATLGWGLCGIVLSGVVTSTLRASVFIPIYTAVITNQSKFSYYKAFIPPFFVALITALVGMLVQRVVVINTIFSLLVIAFGLTMLYFVISIIFLNEDERRFISKKLIAIARRQAT